MQALSMQAAVAVVDANDAGGDESLKVLTSIAQNFPMQVIKHILCENINPAADKVKQHKYYIAGDETHKFVCFRLNH